MSLLREHPFGPEWLSHDKAKTVAEHYLAVQPDDRRKPLQVAFDKVDKRKNEELIQFLKDEGDVLWGEFVRELARTVLHRDYTPLLPKEVEALDRRMKEAFEPPPDIGGMPIRIRTAAALLVSGALVIILAFVSLPYLAVSFQEAANSAFDENVRGAIKSIEAGLKNAKTDEAARLNRDILSSLRSSAERLPSVDILRDRIQPAVRSCEQASKALADLNKGMEGYSADIRKWVLELSKSPVNDSIGKIAAAVDPSVDPAKATEVLTELNRLYEQEDKLTNLLNRAAAALKYDANRDGTYQSWRKVEGALTNVVKDIDTSAAALTTDPMGKRKELKTRAIQSQKNIVITKRVIDVPPDVKKLFSNLGTTVSALGKENDRLATSLGDLKTHQQSLSKSLNETEISPSGVELAKAFQVRGQLEAVTKDVAQNAQNLQSVADSHDNLSAVVQKLKDLSVLQAELLYKGASPGLLLVLAIGGMFVTFGLSSWLRWVKLLELNRQDKIWRARNLMYVRLTAAFVEHGINPTPFLMRLQTAFPTEEGEGAAARLPITETIGEIGKMIRDKGK